MRAILFCPARSRAVGEHRVFHLHALHMRVICLRSSRHHLKLPKHPPTRTWNNISIFISTLFHDFRHCCRCCRDRIVSPPDFPCPVNPRVFVLFGANLDPTKFIVYSAKTRSERSSLLPAATQWGSSTLNWKQDTAYGYFIWPACAVPHCKYSPGHRAVTHLCIRIACVRLTDCNFVLWFSHQPPSANNAKINFREKEKKVLDQILGQGKYDARIRPSGTNGTGMLWHQFARFVPFTRVHFEFSTKH